MAGHFERMKRQASFGPIGVPLSIQDRYGREITEGCEIAMDPPMFGGLVVSSLTPVMDPKVPPGTVRVRGFVHYDFYATKGANPACLRLRTIDELVAAGVIQRKAPESVVEEAVEYVNTAGERLPPPASGSKVEPLIGSIDPGPDPRD